MSWTVSLLTWYSNSLDVPSVLQLRALAVTVALEVPSSRLQVLGSGSTYMSHDPRPCSGLGWMLAPGLIGDTGPLLAIISAILNDVNPTFEHCLPSTTAPLECLKNLVCNLKSISVWHSHYSWNGYISLLFVWNCEWVFGESGSNQWCALCSHRNKVDNTMTCLLTKLSKNFRSPNFEAVARKVY
jgi:hypothetical protein